MQQETDLNNLIKSMNPEHMFGDFVFCSIPDLSSIDLNEILFFFREQEGLTIVIKKEIADIYKLEYKFIASWITLMVHSSLQAVGFTAAFAKTLSAAGISCNVVAAFYHDHLFVEKGQVDNAMEILKKMAQN